MRALTERTGWEFFSVIVTFWSNTSTAQYMILRIKLKLNLFSSACLYVMYQNISEWLTVDYLIAYKVPPTAYHICFHHKSTTLVYVLEDIVIHSLYAQITSVNVLLFPDVCFVSSDLHCFLLLCLGLPTFAFVICCSNKEITICTF